jgi:hypothetical protein
VDSPAELATEIEQPRQASVGGLGDRALHVEVEDRLGRPSTDFREASPAGVAGALRPQSQVTFADRLHGRVVAIGRPMVVEVFEEGRPVVRQAVGLEIRQGKRKAVVDADQGGHVFAQPLRQPLGDAAAGPVLAGAGWRQDLRGRRGPIRQLDEAVIAADFGARIIAPLRSPVRRDLSDASPTRAVLTRSIPVRLRIEHRSARR